MLECFNRHDGCCHVIYVEVVHLLINFQVRVMPMSRHDGCCHVIYVEVVHLNKLPSKSNANEQWQRVRERILLNLTSECGKLQQT